MRTLIVLFLFTFSLFAETYFAKVQPLEYYSLKSAISGRVLSADAAKEGSFVKDGVLIKLDSSLNRENLENLEASKKNIEERIELLKEIVEIKKENYESIKELKTKSKIQKDADLIAYINAKTALNQAEDALINLKMQIAKEEDTIAKSNVRVENLYIERIYPRAGDYVSPGSKLIDAYDISKAKVEIFLSREDIEILDSSRVFIDQRPMEGVIAKKYRVADSQNISSFKVELIFDAPELFSKVVKIEIKKEDTL